MLLLPLGLAAAWTPAPQGPCDVYASAGTPCVAAHSMGRAMYAAYAGPLYSLSRSSDNTTLDIGVKPGVGFADAAPQLTFCTNPSPTVCTVERIYDQSGRGNHLERVRIRPNNTNQWPTAGINAMRDPTSLGGHTIYSAYFEGGEHIGSGTMGFRSNRLNGDASGVAVGDEPESVYMVTAGNRFNHGCCFDCARGPTPLPVCCILPSTLS